MAKTVTSMCYNLKECNLKMAVTDCGSCKYGENEALNTFSHY